MPAWMAGIQFRKDASGNVHVNLDSSSPCWNDAMKVQKYLLINNFYSPCARITFENGFEEAFFVQFADNSQIKHLWDRGAFG